MARHLIGLTVLAFAATAVAGCGDDAAVPTAAAGTGVQASPAATGAYAPVIDPASFSTRIDNPYFPLPVGRHWRYQTKMAEGQETVDVVVLAETKIVDGVTCVVVRDTTRLNTKILEDTYDWYAQDAVGNVWYFGEDTTLYEDSGPNTKGSFAAGVDGAQPGIVMEAHPTVGDNYRIEYDAGKAEDRAKILRLGERVKVPFGSYDDVLVTEDSSPLDATVTEQKFYARGVGLIKAAKLEDNEQEVLVKMTG